MWKSLSQSYISFASSFASIFLDGMWGRRELHFDGFIIWAFLDEIHGWGRRGHKSMQNNAALPQGSNRTIYKIMCTHCVIDTSPRVSSRAILYNLQVRICDI